MTRPRKTAKIVTRPEGPSDLWTTLISPDMGSLVVHCLIERVSLESDPWPTDRSWPDRWFQKLRKDQHAVVVITAGMQDQQRFNYQLGAFFTWRPVLLHMSAGRAVIAGKQTIMSPAGAGYGLTGKQILWPSSRSFPSYLFPLSPPLAPPLREIFMGMRIQI